MSNNSGIYVISHARVSNWANVKKYNKCSTTLRANMSRSGALVTGLTADDEERLEKLLGYPKGELAKTSTFWHTFAVRIDEKGLIINTISPREELIYLFLKAHKRVALGHDAITPSKDFVMINKENEAISKNIANRKKREAILEFEKLSPDQMRKCLRVLGINGDNSTMEVVEATLFDFVETNPEDFFIRWVENKDRDMEYVINQALTKNVIRKNRTTYYYGTDVIGNGLEDVIAYFKDKKNSDIRKAVESAIEHK